MDIRDRGTEVASCFGTDALRFGAFWGSVTSVFNGVSCLLKRLRGSDDAWNPLIAGLLAGYAIGQAQIPNTHTERESYLCKVNACIA
jgi:hypothetical protein